MYKCTMDMVFVMTHINLVLDTQYVCTYSVCAGDYYGDGKVRKKELLHSSAILGISGTHVEIVNDT